MRRTKVAQIYQKTGNLRAVQLLLGHTKMDSAVRYLGVEPEDALAISEAVEILSTGCKWVPCCTSASSIQPFAAPALSDLEQTTAMRDRPAVRATAHQ